MGPRTCPVCGREAAGTCADLVHPFCSERCKLIDLGNWLSDAYAISESVAESDGTEGAESGTDALPG